MISEALMMAMTVWYVPGWMRTQEPERGVLEGLREIYPEADVVFKPWNGDDLRWPRAVTNADESVGRLVDEIAALPQAERASLVLVGHSLGGRIVARALARLGERSLAVRQGVLMAAAIPYRDRDVGRIGNGSALPVLAICNPDDVTLRYAYAVVGGESSPALGANGTLRPLANVEEVVVPATITKETPIDRTWARWQIAKDVANHHALFYLACFKKVAAGGETDGRIMVPQDFTTVESRVMDKGIWWDVLDEAGGWKLERNKVTGHARILDPQKVRRAWGSPTKMKEAFRKVKRAVDGPRQRTTRVPSAVRDGRRQQSEE